MSSRYHSDHISPVVVVIIFIIISFVIVAGIFFVKSGVLSDSLPSFSKPQKTVGELLDRGNPEQALEMIAVLPTEVQESDTSLYTQGKAWYLAAWKRYDADNWKDYAKDSRDWFFGPDVDNALRCLYASAQSEKTQSDAQVLIGVIYMDKGWFEKARIVFREVLNNEPTHREAYLNYGVVLSRLGRNEEAIKHLENIENYESDYDFVKNLFYLYLFEMKNYKQAAYLGNLFLNIAPRGNPDVPKVTREMLDLASRFPEFFDDTMYIIRTRPREFTPRTRAR
ncbi:MAG: tetratricopeptide repeat protein [Chitinivibrionia bacterium]|nr:tetratricopeptide repeat protein [Chitinivibrionia bacterium]